MGFGLAFRQAGFTNEWAVEIDPFCQAIIKTHFRETELHTDVKQCGSHNLKRVDVITGGFPCQDLSVAGKRGGLSASRSGLFFEAARIIGELQPRWFLLENVPGLFSSNQGEDFRLVVETLCQLGYGVAWRTLDSQYFGVAQRRRRVFIVGRFGAICPAEVLFERESGERAFAESEEERPELASEIAACLRGSGGGKRGYLADAEHGLAITGTITKSYGEGIGIADERNLITGYRMQAFGEYANDGTASTLKQRDWKDATDLIAGAPPDADRVRDFTGFPEGLDSARYRALGNAVTVSTVRWIAERIVKCDVE